MSSSSFGASRPVRVIAIASAPELWLVAVMAAAASALLVKYDLPFNLPSLRAAEFAGIHYLLPLSVISLWSLFATHPVASSRVQAIFSSAAYTVILLVHFNLKVWTPHINAVLYDDLLWSFDQQVHWIVDACMFARVTVEALIPIDSIFYIQGFILLFYFGLLYHGIRTRNHFRELVLAAMLLQSLGAFAYILLPALGPFVYESGLNPTMSHVQQQMLEFYRHSMEMGPAWLRTHGSDGLLEGLAAMPSLHAGGSFLFLLFAWRYDRGLVPFYMPIVGFIFVASISSRWHYVIDLPVGVFFAWLSMFVARQLLRLPSRSDSLMSGGTTRPAFDASAIQGQ